MNRKTPEKTSLVGVLLAALLTISPPAEAQQNDPEIRQAVMPLFATHTPLQVTIEAPLTTLARDRPEEEYLDGTFTFPGGDGAAQTVDLKIRTRGNYRRM